MIFFDDVYDAYDMGICVRLTPQINGIAPAPETILTLEKPLKKYDT